MRLQRGLGQGDPLSSFLFVSVIEYLSKLVKRAVGERKFELYTIGGAHIESHLAYADDVTFFCSATTKSLTALREILTEFEGFSGLKINASKSSIIFSKRVTDETNMAAILGFQIKQLPIKYLGTPLTGKLIRFRDCDGLLAELSNILTRWSSKKLSYMGRIQLVEWIFQGKFGYITQSSVVPQAAIRSLQSITYRFIWGSQHEVAWESMTKPKNCGALVYETTDQSNKRQ